MTGTAINGGNQLMFRPNPPAEGQAPFSIVETNGSGPAPRGVSGPTQGERLTMAKLRELGPAAVDTIQEILESDTAPARDRLRAVEIVLDRIYGKPTASVQVTEGRSIEASLAHIQALVAQVKIVAEGDSEYEGTPP